MPKILDMLKKETKRTKHGLQLKVENISTGNVVNMIKKLNDFIYERKGDFGKTLWQGMPDDPSRIIQLYTYRHAKLMVHTKRSRFYDDRQEVHIVLKANYSVDSISKELCRNVFRKYLIPE